MKKLPAICVMGWTCLTFLHASPYSELFSYDAEKFRTELEPLQQLEQLVLEREGFSVEYFRNSSGLSSLNSSDFSTDPAETGFFYDIPRDLPPFVWGCLLSGFGVALVYNASHDNEKTKKAFMGCIVNGIFLTSIYITNLLTHY